MVPGGGDWVLMRPDGVARLDIRFALRTDDGELIDEVGFYEERELSRCQEQAVTLCSGDGGALSRVGQRRPMDRNQGTRSAY